MTHETQFDLLYKRRFLPLFITQFLEAFNDTAFKNAVIVFLTFQTLLSARFSTILIALSGAFYISPYFLFSALAGQLADKYEKSFLIRIIKFFEILILLVGAYAFYHGTIPLLMTTLFLLGIHSTFFGPLKYAILPVHLHPDELIAGNSLVEASTFLAILLGTLVGGELIGTQSGAIVISVLLITLSILSWVSSLAVPLAPAADPSLKISFNIPTETLKIIRHTKENKLVFLAILGISWFWVFGATLLSQIAPFTKNALGANQHVVAILLTFFSLGLTIGSLICNKLLNGEISNKYVPLGVLGMSLFLGDLAYASSNVVIANSGQLLSVPAFLESFTNWRIMIDLFLMAASGGIYIVPLYAFVQTHCEPEYRSRTIACNNIINSIFMLSAAIILSIMVGLNMTTPTVFFLLTILNTAVVIHVCRLIPEAVVKSFVRWILRGLFQVEVSGTENFHLAGDSAVVIANHTSFLDPILMAAFLPEEKFVYAINRQYTTKLWMKPIMAMSESFPIDQSKPMTMKSLIKLVKSGRKCVIFPEGRITVTGALMKVYEGPGLIAAKAGAKIIPIRIEGASHSFFTRLRGKVPIKWFPKIKITVLKPVSLEQDDENSLQSARTPIYGQSLHPRVGFAPFCE